VGSPKKADKGRKDGDRRGRKDDDGLAALVEEIRRQRAELVRNNELLRAAIDWNATVQQQLEAVLTAQRRTNSLLELSLGSAFDAEIDVPGFQA
jgi:hypothetical protein